MLEVGPGGNPHPRANVLLEKIFDDKEIALAQRGFSSELKTKKTIIFYNGEKFPFKDNEFDYVICTHVLEHIPYSELENFILELQRVAKAGFIEFPAIFYELINHQSVHLWYMNYRDNTILFLDKKIFNSNYVHKVMREMFYGNDKYMSLAFKRYRELFFCYFEWKDSINYKIVDSYDELINENDLLKYKEYFSNYEKGKHLKLTPLQHFKKMVYNVLVRLEK